AAGHDGRPCSAVAACPGARPPVASTPVPRRPVHRRAARRAAAVPGCGAGDCRALARRGAGHGGGRRRLAAAVPAAPRPRPGPGALRASSPLRQLRGRPVTGDDLLALAPDAALAELSQLRAVFSARLRPALAARPGRWALGPVFTGSGLIVADADLVASGMLV